jgi:thiol-disulfide isomerase/thioredoxin
MMTRKRPLLLTAAALLVCASTTTAFMPQPPISPSSRTTLTTRIRPRISLVATPFEEMEKEDEMEKDQNDDDDWTEVKGGFLPRIAGLRKQQHALITEVSTLEEYKREVVDCDESIVVVKFYSTWCRTCKAMAPLFKKMANSHSPFKVKFVQVAVTQDNALLHQGLGIPSVPFGHIYHKDAGLVEELKIKKQDFGQFKTVLQHYVNGSCDMKDSVDDDLDDADNSLAP